MGEDIYYPWNVHNAPFQNIKTIVTNQEIKERQAVNRKIDTHTHTNKRIKMLILTTIIFFPFSPSLSINRR